MVLCCKTGTSFGTIGLLRSTLVTSQTISVAASFACWQMNSNSNAAGVEQSSSTFQGDAFVGCEDGSKTRRQHPRLMAARASGAEHGDCPGRLVDLDTRRR